MLTALIAGTTLGLSVALPFGPVSLLCVQRSIIYGRRLGLAVGAGAASAQGIYAAAALVGHSAIPAELATWTGPLRWCSAAVLVLLGLRTLRRHRVPRPVTPPAGTRVVYGSTLALALSNPMTALPYLAIASGSQPAEIGDALFSSWSVPGVVAGSGAWYALLVAGASLLRAGVPGLFLRHLNLLAGSMLIVLGLWIGLR